MMFLEDYVDTMESLPAELARNFTLIKELDQVSHDVMEGVRTDTDHFLDKVKAMNKEERVQWLQKLSGDFKEALRHGEEKVALASQTYEMVDRHIRRLDEDLARYEEEMMTAPRNQGNRERRPDSYANGYQQYEDPGRKRKDVAELQPTPNKKVRMTEQRSARAPSPELSTKLAGRKMVAQDAKRKVKKVSSAKSVPDYADVSIYRGIEEVPVDPNEPTYCLCGRVSFGEMIACDDEECEIEWFHYECVGLTAPLKAKAKWYCPQCSQKRAKGRK